MAAARAIEVGATMELQKLQLTATIPSKIDLGELNKRDYEKLTNKPKINGVEISGDKSLSDYGIDKLILQMIDDHNNDLSAHEVLLASSAEVETLLQAY